MTNNSTLLHIALQYEDEQKADVFFRDILDFDTIKEFVLLKKFSKKVFNINKDVKVKAYSNGNTVFEVFITAKKPRVGYEHCCLLVKNKVDLLNKCRKYGIKIIVFQMNNKEYIFIKDFSGYFYEIK